MKRDFAALQGEFDLLVCGGGIYGAWTAYDAALRGLKVALVERRDWAGATSSASSKLIHGGLRYLETYDFKLVKKALAERQCLLRIAPHRVWPLRFGVPVYADSRNGLLKLKAGLTLYDMLAGFPDERMRHRRFNHAHFARHFPYLDDATLKGGYTYGDAQTDDARLVLELVAGAVAHGAVCVNYAHLVAWNEESGQLCGATVRDDIGDTTVQVMARQCVSTAGQWLADDDAGRAWCRLTKGVHLVLPGLAASEAILLTAKSDGRVFFVIPWYGRTLLGTTDTDYRGDLADVTVEEADVDYLLEAANRYLKTAWNRQDVIGSYAGLRVMKRSDDASPSAASRDWELKTMGNGLRCSVGGKITSAREDACSIVDAVCAALAVDKVCASGERDLPWKPQQDFAAWLEQGSAQAAQLGIDGTSATWLLRRHGLRSAHVFALIEQRPELAQRIVPDLPFIYADLLCCARDEMVVHLDDLLRRRMPLLILAKLTDSTLQRIAATVATVLGWDEAAMEREIEACRGAMNRAPTDEYRIGVNHPNGELEMISAIALDLGTTSVKAGLLDGRGELGHIVARPAPYITVVDGRYESDALAYAEIAEQVLNECVADAGGCTTLGLCSQRSSFLVWEQDTGQPLTPLISWQDDRGAASCEALRDSEGLIRELTGLPLAPYYFAPKLRVVLQENPGWLGRLERGELRAGTLDTFLIWRWTGGKYYITDASMAARTLLMDIRRQCWSPALCELFGIPVQILPQITSSSAINLCLDNGLLLQASVGDQSAALIAGIDEGRAEALVNLGTGGFVVRYLREGETASDGYLRTLVYRDGRAHLAVEGTLNSIAAALAPYPAGECSPADLASDDIFCLAEPSGLGAPYLHSGLGLQFSEPVEHLPPRRIAALLLEAVIFRVARILEDFHRDSALERIYLSGGLSELACLQQGIAQCVPFEVYRLDQRDSSLQGAALLAAGIAPASHRKVARILTESAGTALPEKYRRWKAWLDGLLVQNASGT